MLLTLSLTVLVVIWFGVLAALVYTLNYGDIDNDTE